VIDRAPPASAGLVLSGTCAGGMGAKEGCAAAGGCGADCTCAGGMGAKEGCAAAGGCEAGCTCGGLPAEGVAAAPPLSDTFVVVTPGNEGR